MGYDNYQQFVLNLVGSVVTCIGSLAGVSLADRMPRRKVLVCGTFACAVFLAINGGLSAVWAKYPSGEQNISVGQGAVAAFFFFNLAYGFTYLPLAALYPVECLQTTARAKGMAMSGVVVNLMLFINQFCGPIALQNIQYNYVFVSRLIFFMPTDLIWPLPDFRRLGRHRNHHLVFIRCRNRWKITRGTGGNILSSQSREGFKTKTVDRH